MKSPKREMQLEQDYQRHKILRRIKKRRKRQAESAQHLAEKWFQHKMRRPRYDDGKDDDVEVVYAEPTKTIYRQMKDIGLDPETGDYVDNTTGQRGSLQLPEFTVNWDREKNRMMTSREVTENFYRKHIPYSSSFDGNLVTAPTDWLVENVVSPVFNSLISGFANYGTTPQQLADPQYQAFMQGQTQKAGELLSYTLPSKYLDTGNTTLNFAMDMLAGKYAPKTVKAGTKYVGRKTAPIWMPRMLDRGIRNATKTGEIRVGSDGAYSYEPIIPEKRIQLNKPETKPINADVATNGGIEPGDEFKYKSTRSKSELENYFKNTNAIYARKYMLGQDVPAEEWVIPSSWQRGAHFKMPDNVARIFLNSVIPRMQRSYKDAANSGGVLAWKRANEMPDWVDLAAKEGYYTVNDATFEATLPDSKWALGYYTRDGDFILVRNDGSLWALPHEFRHKFDNKYKLTAKSRQKLKDAYGNMEDALLIDEDPTMVEYASNAESEFPTTNLDARTKLIGEYHAENTPTYLQDKMIDAASEDAIVKAIETSNGYGRRLIKYMRDNNLINEDWVKAVKEAMKYVGIANIPLLIQNMFSQEEPHNNSGKDLYSSKMIKPRFKKGKDDDIQPGLEYRDGLVYDTRNWERAPLNSIRHVDDPNSTYGVDAYGNIYDYSQRLPEVTVSADRRSIYDKIAQWGPRANKYTYANPFEQAVDAYNFLVPGALKYATWGLGSAMIPGLPVDMSMLPFAYATAVDATPKIVRGSWNDPEDQYNRGKGIHINPKNRGKFNATKKRTGKTTELLTHSKNPLTRKRAIFAQNAKKWRH